MKVLVTGGRGFIGSHVVDLLLNEYKLEVIVLDRVARAPLLGTDNFLGDIRDNEIVDEAVALSDGVIHLAGLLGTSETINTPQASINTNIIGSLNVFDACRRFGVPCVNISVGNYWMNNTYSITKDTAERFAWMMNTERGSKIATVRALNAYGSGQKVFPVRKLIPNLIVPVLMGRSMLVYGDGSQIMDMIHVTDVADVLVRALLVDHNQYEHSDLSLTSPKFEAGTGRRTTVLEIAETVIDMLGTGTIKHIPMRKGEPEKSIVVGNPKTLLPLYGGELPNFKSLREGLELTIPYYKELINV